MAMTIPMRIMQQEIECADIDELTDLILIAAAQLHSAVALDCIKGAHVVVTGTNKDTKHTYIADVTRKD